MKNKLNYEVPDMEVLEMSCEGCIATSGNTPGYTNKDESWDNDINMEL